MSSLLKLLSSCKSRHSEAQREPTPSPSCRSSSCRGLAQRPGKTAWALAEPPFCARNWGGVQRGHTDKVGVGLALRETDLYEGDPRGCRESRHVKGRGFCLVPAASYLPLRDRVSPQHNFRLPSASLNVSGSCIANSNSP